MRIVGLDYAPANGASLAAVLEGAGGDGRNPHVDTSSPLLIVYTSGTTGRPKGAVLRQEALMWNAVMSQHMHDMTAHDHVLTVLPLFHVGGLNIQTTPALQLGATVTLHARFAPEATLEAIERDRPTLTVLVPATIQAMLDHPRWAGDAARQPARADDRLDAGAAAAGRRHRERGVPVLQVYGSTETCPDRRLHAAVGRLARARARPACRGSRARRRIVDDDGERGAARHAPARWLCAGRTCSSSTGATRRRRPRRCARAGITAATSACATPTGISSSTTARRT